LDGAFDRIILLADMIYAERAASRAAEKKNETARNSQKGPVAGREQLAAVRAGTKVHKTGRRSRTSA
jgi:hypothetical protein